LNAIQALCQLSYSPVRPRNGVRARVTTLPVGFDAVKLGAADGHRVVGARARLRPFGVDSARTVPRPGRISVRRGNGGEA
jgi:hypothetical protein